MFRRALFAFALLGSFAGCARAPKTPSQPVALAQVWGSKGTAPGEFRGPRAIVAARDGHVYVADRASHISKWTQNGKFIKQWLSPVSNNGRFEGPEGITDLPNGDLAVTNTHASRVLIYSAGGKLKSQFGSYGTGKGQFLLVTGITTDKDGFIYTADYGGEFDRISKYTRDGKQIANWVGHGEGKRQFRRPCGLAIDSHGDLLVADIGNHRIQILDRKTGAYKGQFGPARAQRRRTHLSLRRGCGWAWLHLHRGILQSSRAKMVARLQMGRELGQRRAQSGAIAKPVGFERGARRHGLRRRYRE